MVLNSAAVSIIAVLELFSNISTYKYNLDLYLFFFNFQKLRLNLFYDYRTTS